MRSVTESRPCPWPALLLAGLFLLLPALLPAAPADASAAADTASESPRLIDRIVAIVEDDVVTWRELQQRMERIERQLRDKGIAVPDLPSLRRQVLERLILERLQLQLAKRLGIRIDDLTLDRQMERLARANQMSLQQFRDKIVADGIDYGDFREEVRRELTLQALHKRMVDPSVQVSDREVDDLIASQSQALFKDTEFHIRHILVAVPEQATPEQVRKAREKAERLLKALKEGADFAELAARESDGRYALQGGDMGWRPLGRLPRIFVRPLALLKVSQISDIIRSPAGFHIIKLEGKRGGQQAWVEQTHARHILIKTSALTSDADARATLQSLRARIEGGDDFARLARAYSDDTGSAIEGGDLGWANPGTFVPEFEAVLKKLKPGEISAPFKTQYGWHIVQLLERRRVDNTVDLLRSRARQLLYERKREEQLREWLRRLRDEAHVEYLMPELAPDEND